MTPTPADSTLLRELRGIRAIDNHAHVVRPIDGDTDYDALPFSLLDPPPPGTVSSPATLRNEYSWFVRAWKALYNYPYSDVAPEHLKQVIALKKRAMAQHPGVAYPSWVLDRQGVDIALANRVTMPIELPFGRFRWVPYADALLFPLDNSAQKAANRDYAAFYPAEEKLLKRYLTESGARAAPPTLTEYCQKILTPTLERHKNGGAVAEKLEAAYLRWLDFGPASEEDAARIYARYAKGGVPPAAEYKTLQDYLFAYLAREAGRLGLALHIHVANGGGANYDQRGSNPLLLTWAFNEPSLRKTNFVIVHGGYPHYDTTLGLIGKPNVYADFSALSYFEGVDGQARMLHKWIAQWPEKILYGSDASPTTDDISWEETGWVASQTAREALARVLDDLIRDRTITRARASEIARLVLRDNASKLYRLGQAYANADWPMHGGIHNAHYSTLTQIDKSNVAQLKVAWTYESGDHFKGSEMQSNPIVVDGMLFVTTPTLKVVALDAVTGKEVWKFDPSGGAPSGARFRHRGVAYYVGRVFVTYRNWLYALDAKTGKPIPTFGANGRVDLREGLGRPADKLTVTASTPGVGFENMLIIGSTVPETLPSAPGDIRAYDVDTGKIRWTFHTIPRPGEFGYDTWPKEAWQIAGGANAWSGLSLDASLGMVFAATGSSSFDFYGENRKGDNWFADCVLALDARTGRRVWHFQGLRHDVWDLDFPSAPTLVTVRRNRKYVDAVAQVTKTGYVFVLDRMTGKPLFPIVDQPVSRSAIEGEQLSPTQPVPAMPPPFTRGGPTEAMLTTRTPEAHAAVLKQFRQLKAGRFAPPSLQGTIIFPGVDGGAEWGGAAFDIDSGLLFVNSNEMPWIVRLIENSDTSLYNAKCASCHKTDRTGTAVAPTLIDIGKRKTRDELIDIIRHGTGRMPGYPDFGTKNANDMVDFLITGKDRGADPNVTKEPTYVKYRSDGETLWRDPDGYPPLTPPWGTLNAIDLNAGTIKWKIPFGEYPELVAKGLRNTGSDNYGGPVVTASGLLFIGATNFDKKFHAYDKLTGKLLWETTLPAAGNATPSIYALDGREYIVIACGGGKNGAPSGSSIVAFALPR